MAWKGHILAFHMRSTFDGGRKSCSFRRNWCCRIQRITHVSEEICVISSPVIRCQWSQAIRANHVSYISMGWKQQMLVYHMRSTFDCGRTLSLFRRKLCCIIQRITHVSEEICVMSSPVTRWQWSHGHSNKSCFGLSATKSIVFCATTTIVLLQ